ncbi:aminopeptidase N [Rubrimonas cliftonensis]|uniref:Aminopeptidase N n=1 Tax=Rubrimonas cliftonensis TaxID=89524 RepID=A0A1H3W663_9RHOB|nr:aminopeptidase N [Rubrimonas cliftonensis]SDZ82556.1 aminopeptidase N [Rubrimonas cliftonensis]
MRTEDASAAPAPVRLADYRPPAWLIESVRLTFDLRPRGTRVTARLALRRNPDGDGGPLRLDGRNLRLVAASVDGAPVSPETDAEGLTLSGTASGAALPDAFVWEAVTEIDPEDNKALEGLYLSRGMFCTQCEAQGFRKITFFPDRPDVMAMYEVRIEADAGSCPALLSNGDLIESGALPKGRHYAVWRDPHPKPCYLFALVAGDLRETRADFTTVEGRQVRLGVWVRPGDEGRTAYAMDSLIRSMRWDERAYGRAYDLDVFNIVAVDDFNMGAMENKGLNIFNAKYVLASPETATDADYARIESIVAHEYFHNWTGNRITCRDWFQLCLKEGLTVFRDQQFTADERSAPVKRIEDVVTLRARQFREDGGPLAHPVRPEEYIEINNFYTATIYEKGAEVIGMLHTLFGPEGYRKALDLYFERHDGQACAIEDFRRCFEDATGRDLTQFARWWSQAGTPEVGVEESWQEDGGRYALIFRQSTPPTPGQPDKAPLVIPVALGLLGANGDDLLPEGTRIVELTEAETAVTFEGLPARPVPSLLRGFSAPVRLIRETSDAERAFLMAHDSDAFNRWEAGRAYAVDVALRMAGGADADPAFLDALDALASDESLDPAFRALALETPGEDELARETFARGTPADPQALHAARDALRRAAAGRMGDALERLHREMTVPGPYSPDAAAAGRRALRNRALGLLVARGAPDDLARAAGQFERADNMSDAFPALAALVHADAPQAAAALAAFHDRWRDDPVVMDKWFAVQATAPADDALGRVRALTEHPLFDWLNPNRFRSLVGAFAAGNPSAFHAADGAGYAFLADWLIRLDAKNPQTTARMAGAFETWGIYDAGRQRLIRDQLERIAAAPGLSRDTGEMVSRMLGAP